MKIHQHSVLIVILTIPMPHVQIFKDAKDKIKPLIDRFESMTSKVHLTGFLGLNLRFRGYKTTVFRGSLERKFTLNCPMEPNSILNIFRVINVLIEPVFHLHLGRPRCSNLFE